MSIHSLCLAPAIFHYRPRGQLIVIAQLLKICPLGFTEVKGLTPGSQPVFMPLPTKGFVMNREPQETKAFSKDKQLCSIHQHLHSPPPSLVKTHFLTEIICDRGGSKTHKDIQSKAKARTEQRRNSPFEIQSTRSCWEGEETTHRRAAAWHGTHRQFAVIIQIYRCANWTRVFSF